MALLQPHRRARWARLISMGQAPRRALFRDLTQLSRGIVVEIAMHKPKPYKCSICGAEVPNVPMPVLKHQLSHVSRRPLARHQPRPAKRVRKDDEASRNDADRT